MQYKQFRLSKTAQHVSKYTQPSFLTLQRLLGAAYFFPKASRTHTLDLVYAGTEALTLTLSICREVSIYSIVRLHLLNRSLCSTMTSLNILESS